MILLSPLILFLLTNAWLYSPWGAAWVAEKLSQKIGLPTTIRHIHWMPGGSIQMDGLVIQQPPVLQDHCDRPVLSIETISIRPAWKRLLRGQKEVISVALERPHLCVTAEMLVDLMRRGQQDLSATIPVAPASPTQPPEVANATPPPTEQTPQAPPTTTPVPVAPPAIAVAPVEKDTAWLTVHGGSLMLYYASASRTLAEITGIDAAIPISGKAATGHLRCEQLIGLQSPAGAIDLQLAWQQPLLTIPEQSFTLWGFQFRGGAQLARLPGLPFSAGMAQKNSDWQSPGKDYRAGKIESLHRINGLLAMPASWSAESIVQALDVHAKLGTRETDFFLASSRCVLQRGICQCSDARALGDDLGLMANGLFLADGRFSARTRVITPRRNTAVLGEKIHTIFPGLPMTFSPFPHEDRQAIDLLLGGDWQTPWVSLDEGKNLLDLRKMISLWQQHPIRTQP